METVKGLRAEPTGSPQIEKNPQPYVISEAPDKTPLYRGELSTENVEIKVDQKNKTVKIKGIAKVKDAKTNQETKQPFEVQGNIDAQGFATLKPVNLEEDKKSNLQIRSKVTCFSEQENDCAQVVADIFVHSNSDKKYHVTQVQSVAEIKMTTKKTQESPISANTPATPSMDKNAPPPKDKIPENPNKTNLPGNDKKTDSPDNHIQEPQHDEDEETEPDQEMKPDLYVGHIFTDFVTLFNDNAPAETEVKNAPPVTSRPTDQAIGSPSQGSLRNGTNIIDKIAELKKSKNSDFSKLLIPNLSRQRTFGTFELVELILKMSEIQSSIKSVSPFVLSDLSQKEGGHLINSKHVSHQNGLDTDIAYFLKSTVGNSGFPNIVDNEKLTDNFPQEEWLRYMISVFQAAPTAIDRIFVNDVIKKNLCQKAKSLGLLNSSQKNTVIEVLRRLRPWDGHSDHFHLRIKCSKFHPRCRQMEEPPAGSGCP